jgi:hypothetical protein
VRFTGPKQVTYVARVQDAGKDSPYRYYRVTQSAK